MSGPGLDAAAVLRAWEVGRAQPPVERALTLLSLATGQPAGSLAALAVTERDRQLRAVRAATFGTSLEARVDCPACADPLEFSLDLSDGGWSAADDEVHHLAVRGNVSVDFRLPTSADLMAAGRVGSDPSAVRAAIGRQCVVSVEGLDDGGTVPEWVVDEVAAAMDAAAGADSVVALACPSCGHRWEDAIDIGACLWAEVDAEARRLLHEVAVLARAFAWTEADVLALTPARRAAYLELAT